MLCDSSRVTRPVRKSYYGLGAASAKLAKQTCQFVHVSEYFHFLTRKILLEWNPSTDTSSRVRVQTTRKWWAAGNMAPSSVWRSGEAHSNSTIQGQVQYKEYFNLTLLYTSTQPRSNGYYCLVFFLQCIYLTVLGAHFFVIKQRCQFIKD